MAAAPGRRRGPAAVTGVASRIDTVPRVRVSRICADLRCQGPAQRRQGRDGGQGHRGPGDPLRDVGQGRSGTERDKTRCGHKRDDCWNTQRG